MSSQAPEEPLIFMHSLSRYLHFLCDSLLAISCLAQPISVHGMGLSVMDCYEDVYGDAYSTSNVSRGFGDNSIASAIVCSLHGLQKNVDTSSKINIVREVTTRSGVRYIYIYVPVISTDENEIKKMAAMLNNSFTKYKKIRAIIFDKYALARFWAFGSYDDVTDLEVDARVVYFLNRTTSEEYIQYSSERGKSVLEKKIVVHEKKVSLRRTEGTPMIRGAVDTLLAKNTSEKLITVSSEAAGDSTCLSTDKLESQGLVQIGNLNKKALNKKQPKYPYEAKKHKLSGTVIVDVIVDLPSGKIEKAKIRKTNDFFKEEVIKVVCGVKFPPLTDIDLKSPQAFGYLM